jgi:3-hydroxyisobutyrate dehydrogenase
MVTPPVVTVVGLGAIGFPMARRLLDAGYDVRGVDPSPVGAERAESVGMRCDTDVATAELGEVVLVLVATGQQVLDVVTSAITAAGDLTGQDWVIVSTIGPADATEAGSLLVGAGARVVDAPVTGGVPGAESGSLRFLAAGHPDVIADLDEILNHMGSVVVVGDGTGDGQAMKIVNQLCSSTHLVVAAEAVNLARVLGLDPGRAVEVIAGGSGSSWFLDDRGGRMAGGADEVLTRLAILAKDNSLVAAEAARTGARVPMLLAAREQYALAEQRGLLELDDSQVVQTYSEAGAGDR